MNRSHSGRLLIEIGVAPTFWRLCGYLFTSLFLVLGGVSLGVELLARRLVTPPCLRKHRTVPAGAHFHVPASSMRGPQFRTPFPGHAVFWSAIIATLVGVKWHLVVVWPAFP